MASLVETILENCNYQENEKVDFAKEEEYKSLINQTFKRVKIDKVRKLNNKHLYAAFMLKKFENQDYEIIEMIHATAAKNVDSIEQKNLDWRLVTRSRYGDGVSFSQDADYANFYCNKLNGDERAYIICDVLVKSKLEVCADEFYDEVPSKDYDTVQSYDGHVYVKFDDFTFYPKYALYYKRPGNKHSAFHYLNKPYYD